MDGSIPEEDVPAPARRQSGSQGGDDLVCPDGKPPAEPFAELRVTSVQVVETPCPDHSIETLRRWAESVGVRTPDDSSSELPETPLVNEGTVAPPPPAPLTYIGTVPAAEPVVTLPLPPANR